MDRMCGAGAPALLMTISESAAMIAAVCSCHRKADSAARQNIGAATAQTYFLQLLLLDLKPNAS